MCNETGIPELLDSRILGIPCGRDCDVTYALPAPSYPTRFYPRAHPTHIYVSRAIQILKNPPEYTMQNRVQSGRNTKNITHAHLLGIA